MTDFGIGNSQLMKLAFNAMLPYLLHVVASSQVALTASSAVSMHVKACRAAISQ